MPQRRFPLPWRFEPIPGGYRVIDANGLALTHIEPLSLGLPKRLPVPEVTNHLVCSVCGARNSDTYHPIWVRPDVRVGVVGHYPDFAKT